MLVSDGACLKFLPTFPITTLKCAGEVWASPCPLHTVPRSLSVSYSVTKSMCKFLGAISAVLVFSWCCALFPLNSGRNNLRQGKARSWSLPSAASQDKWGFLPIKIPTFPPGQGKNKEGVVFLMLCVLCHAWVLWIVTLHEQGFHPPRVTWKL